MSGTEPPIEGDPANDESERPGLGHADDPADPDQVSPDVVAPTIEPPGSMPPKPIGPY